MEKASGVSLVPVRYVLPQGWAHLLEGLLGKFGGSLAPSYSGAPPLFKHVGELRVLGGSRSQGCHGYLLAMPEAFRLPSNL